MIDSASAPSLGTAPPLGRLQHLGVLRVSGPDALAFLQGQLSNDTRRLANEPLLAAYSSPQGRVLALMHCLPYLGSVAAILPRELVQPTLESLRRFVLRAKVKLEDAGESLIVVGAHGAEGLRARSIDAPAARGYTETGGIGAACVGGSAATTAAGDGADRAPRYWLIAPPAQFAALGIDARAADADRAEESWRLADVRAGLPQVYAATREIFVAQMLNLDLLDAISFSKGCYTGQEIIARTQHLGRIKRRMYRLRLPPGRWAVGATVHLRDGRSGRLTEVAPVGDQSEALAVLGVHAGAAAPDSADAHSASIAAAAEMLPLPYAVPAD